MRLPASSTSLLVLAGALALLSGCSIQRIAIGGLSSALASGGDVFATDDDPEFIRAALPFGLKTTEALIQASPEDPDLLLAACRGFTQYAYAFLEVDAELIEDEDYRAAEALRGRALRMYLRARDYGLGALELTRPGVSTELQNRPYEAVAGFERDDLPVLFWTGLAWGAAMSVGVDRPEIVADVDAVRALLTRSLELDETFRSGGVHQAMMRIESLPELMGGSPDRARQHYERAVEMSGGLDSSPFVSYATSICVPQQDRRAFQEALESALAIDPGAEPSLTLANHIEQRRARYFLSIADDLFLEPADPGDLSE